MCDSSKPWEFGTLWAKTLADTNFTWRELFKISDGTKIDDLRFTLLNILLILLKIFDNQDIFLLILLEHIACMRLKVLIQIMIKEKRINGSGEKWNFTSYSNPSLPTQGEILTDYSQCGFIKERKDYWDIRKGDKEFTTIYSTYKQLISNYTSVAIFHQIYLIVITRLVRVKNLKESGRS